MSFAITRTTGDGSTPTFTIGFSYRDEADLIVKVNGVTQTLGTHFEVSTGGTIIDFSQGSSPLGAPTNGHSVFISRATSQTSRLVDYAAGSVFKEADLDTDSEQGFFMAQEAIDIANESITVDANNNWDAGNKRIINVADPVNNQDAVNKQFISTNLPNINTVAGISSDVTTVAGISSDVTTVAADTTDIGTVATNISSVNTVATNIADVVTVANDLNEAISEIETAADDLNEAVSEIDTVAQNITNVNTVGTNISDVNTVAGIQANVTTVAGNNANVSTVAGISSDVTTVAGIQANVTAVAGDATDIGTVATDLAGTDTIGTVAGNISNVNTVAGNNTNINTVAGVSSDVTTVAGISSNVSTVATNNTNINTVAGSISNVNAVGGDITNVNTVASNLTDVNAFADTYFISATAPASPSEGDLWFDTTNDVMKVYDGSGFVNAGSSVNGTSNRTTYTATAGQTSFAATYDSGFVDVYLNGVKLINGTDFTATNGSSVVLTTGAAVNDTVDIVGYGTFQLQNTSLDDLSDVSSASASSGQFLKYNGTNWVADSVPASGIADVVDDTSPQLGGNLDLNSNDITGTGNIDVTGTVTADGLTIDTNTLYVDSTNNRVGIGTTSPASALDIERATGTVKLQLQSRDYSDCSVIFGDNDDGDVGRIVYQHSDNSLRLFTNGAERFKIEDGGEIDATCLYAHTTEYTGNLNDLKTTGFYRSNSGNANNPSTAYYSVVVYGNQGNVTAQIATVLAGTTTYVRSFNTSWTSWQRLDT